MSHITQKQTEITSLELLAATARKLGYPLITNAMPRYYGTTFGGGESMVCDAVLQLPGKYDLGFKYDPASGTFAFVCDSELLSGNFGRGSEGRKIVGENAVTLLTAYGEASVELMLAQSGISDFTREIQPDGSVRYVVGDPAELGLIQGA